MVATYDQSSFIRHWKVQTEARDIANNPGELGVQNRTTSRPVNDRKSFRWNDVVDKLFWEGRGHNMVS